MLNDVEVVGYGKTDTGKALRSQNWLNLKSPSVMEALIIIDGKQKTYDDMKLIDVNTIQSINVLNKDTALKMYGDKGKNGAIILTTKK